MSFRKPVPFYLVACLLLCWTGSSSAVEVPSGPLSAALESYLSTGEAPVVSLPAERSYPYPEVPTVKCHPYRACSIRLGEGEAILGRAVGDAERWQWVELTEGAAPIVVVKPVDYDLRTNALIVTEARVYRLELMAPPREAAEQAGYDSMVSFWYPEAWAQETAREEAARVAAPAVPSLSMAASSLDELHVDYSVRKPLWPPRRLRWEPVTVLDDGKTTLVHLPWEARHAEPPVALGALPDGEAGPLNARLDPSGRWLIIPAVVERFRLVVGERHLTVVRGRDD